MKKLNFNGVKIRNSWLNADGDVKPSLSDAFFKDRANLYSSYYGQNEKIKNEIISKAKSIASKYNNFKGKNIDELKSILESVKSQFNESSRLESQAKSSLTDKYDDMFTSNTDASKIAERNVRDVEGSYPNINHKYANLIKNILDHHISSIGNEAIKYYLEELIKSAQTVEDEIEYATSKNTYDAWKKLSGKAVLDTQKKLIDSKIKELTPKSSVTNTKVNTQANANEMVNGSSASPYKKWIIIGGIGFLSIGVLYFVFKKSSN